MDAMLKEEIGKVLLPVLDPFHKVDGCPLLSVWEAYTDDDLEAIELEFESGFLIIAVDGEDDTIDISISPAPGKSSKPASELVPWKGRIGQTFGWGWIGVNQQGYLDGVGLSFGSVTPQYCITAIASRLFITENHSIVDRNVHEKQASEPSDVVRFAKSA